MNGFQDIELLSAYLDGQLSPSEAARLESQLTSDTDLASALGDLRAARGILRQLPARKAPRNFMLTRKMVGVRPPLPQSFSIFRFSSALATALLMITFAFNYLGSHLALGAGAPAAPAIASGAGGGGGPSFPLPFAGAAATEAPAATEAAAATQAPAMELAPLATELSPSAADSARLSVTPTPELVLPKEPESQSALPDQFASRKTTGFSPSVIQIVLVMIALFSALGAFIIQFAARRKWR